MHNDCRPSVAWTGSIEDAKEAVEAGEGVLWIVGRHEQQEEDHGEGAHLLGGRCVGDWPRNWHQQGFEHGSVDKIGIEYTNSIKDRG